MTSWDSQKYAVSFAIYRVKFVQMCNFASSKTYLNLAQLVVRKFGQVPQALFNISLETWQDKWFVCPKHGCVLLLLKQCLFFLSAQTLQFLVNNHCAGVVI